jgi:hypothetical protein
MKLTTLTRLENVEKFQNIDPVYQEAMVWYVLWGKQMNKHHKNSINIDDLDHRIYTALH